MMDIAEQICLAVDQIVSERLKSIRYDTTIVATIIDDSKASENQYVCSNGSSQFVAFSKDTTYKINEAVQVTVPNDDYSQQKIIIGRYVVESGVPYAFVQPFDTIVDVTTNLINNNTDIVTDSLLANENYDKVESVEPQETALWSKYFEEGYSGFNRLGIQGQFRSWLAALKPKSGSYGYRLELITTNGEVIANSWLIAEWIKVYAAIQTKEDYDATGLIDNTTESWFIKVKNELGLTVATDSNATFKKAFIETFGSYDKYSEERKNMVYALLYCNNVQFYNLYLDSSEMYGNPYNFQSYFEQEKVYDISNLKMIYGMSLYFYQQSGSFVTDQGDPLSYKTAGGSRLPDNLFTKDPYICLGYDIGEFDKEQAVLYTTNNDTYIFSDTINSELNKKIIRLRWLHEFEDGQIKVISEASEISDYDIRWYRYQLGAASADEYSGVYWNRIEPDKSSPFNYILEPKVNAPQEQVKVVILHDDKVIRSNILTFTNEREAASGVTTDIISGLSIWCDDMSNGNYFVYGQNNNLINEQQANEIMTLKAKFAESSLLATEYNVDKVAPDLQEATEINWEFPLQQTMIVVHGFNYNYIINDDEIDPITEHIRWDWVAKNDPTGERFKLPGYYQDTSIQVFNNTIRITRVGSGDNGNTIDAAQDYRIAKTYSASKINNTVRCSIKKDFLLYGASKELAFGIMGTNGTDATLVIDFDNNRTALTATLATDEDGNQISESLAVTARLYDYNHKELDFNNLDLNLSCHWEWEYYYQGLIHDKEISQDAVDIVGDAVKAFRESLPKDYEEQQVWEYQNSIAKIKLNSITSPTCYIEHSEPLNISGTKNVDVFFLILKVTVSGYGDYDLVAYKAIPIRKNAQYRNLIGPTEIIYSTSGYPNYYKQPLQLYWCDDAEKVNALYDTVADDYTLSQFATTWNIYNPLTEDNNYIATINNNIIQPPTIFIQNAAPYGVVCYSNVQDKDDPVWIQPFVIMQNEYPSSTVNKWDGKTIQVDEKDGVILTPAIAAGHKSSNDGKFSGVMLGSWRHTDAEHSLTDLTGVYGFHEGKMSYAFKEDGTGFIGKSGKGRIILNGDTGVIKSETWREGENETGLFLDLDDGILKLQKEPGFDTVPVTLGTYQPGLYYILKTTPIQVPLGTPYQADFNYGSGATFRATSDITYYKKAMVPLIGMNEAVFKAKVEQQLLYIKTDNRYDQCTEDMPFATSNKYFSYTYKAVPNLTEEEFKLRPSSYYVKHVTEIVVEDEEEEDTPTTGDDTTGTEDPAPPENVEGEGSEEEGEEDNPNVIVKVEYLQAPPSYNVQSEYYLKVFTMVALTKEQYEANPEEYYLESPGNYELVKSTEKYNKTQAYYEYGYEAQNYGLSGIPEKWNTIDDLGANNYYYVMVAEYVLCTAQNYDPTETYYADNRGMTARYITLSAAASSFPLAIGNHSSVYARKFRVDWDGTCYIQDGKFSGTIDAYEGFLWNLTVKGQLALDGSGSIIANKTALDDFQNYGFYLSGAGLNIGGPENFFYASPSASFFYNAIGGSIAAVKVTGAGISLFGQLAANEAMNKILSEEGSALHVGWMAGKYACPFIRFGNGTGTFGYQTDAGIVKKYTGGIWIGTHGANSSQDSPKEDGFKGMTGIYVHLTSGYIDRYENGKITNIRYAVFAPDNATVESQ